MGERRSRLGRGKAFNAATHLCLLLLLGAAGLALKSPAQGFQYTRSLWRTADGLPEATVQALAETPDGMLWIGTTGGLASFGGLHIHGYSAGGMQVLGVNSIFCLTRDRDGSLWAGTEGGGLLHVRGNNVTLFAANQGLTDGFVRTVYQDRRGTLWVGTDNGLFRMQAGHLQRFDDGAAVPHVAVHAITEDRDGNIWVGGSQLFSIDPNGVVKGYVLPGAYSKNRVKTILQTKDGTVWVGTVGGLQRLSNGRFQAVPAIESTVRSMLQTSDGTLWIGTIGAGLWTMHGEVPKPLRTPNVLPSDTVLTMLQDGDGQIWIGTQAGMVRLSQTPVRVVPLPQAGDPDFETISGDAEGTVWVAAQRLFEIRNGVARRLTFPGLEGLSVRNVFRARDGVLWVGTDGSGAFRLQGGSIRHLSAPDELTNNFIRGFLQTRDGAIWIATDEGVSRVASDRVRKFTETSGLVHFSTRCLLEDRAGGVWIGTDRGVSLWRNEQFLRNPVTMALAHEKVWSILQDRQGVLWFATRDHGLFRLRDGQLHQFTTAQGLDSNSIYVLLQDRLGTFWLTGPDEISSVSEADMDQEAPSATEPLSVTVYGMPFGADSAQMYGGRQPAGFVASDTVWFPTSRGAASIDINRVPPQGRAPKAVINLLDEDGRSVPLHTALRVPAGVTRLTFGFGAVFLRAGNGLRFRYRLEPLESTWNNAAAEDTATYANLAAGQYRFRVQAFDEAHPDAIGEDVIGFTKARFFYQTWWFYTLVFLAVAGAILAVYWVRVGQIRKRFQAVLAERNRLAREMHDTVIQGCTGISALLEAMASKSDGAIDRELLQYARDQTRTTIDEARHAVWDMRHDEKDVDLLEAMRALAEQTAREHGNSVVLHSQTTSLSLGTSAAHEVLMTVREAVYNAVQHSGSKRVELIAEERQDELMIRVTDFGRGFNVGSTPDTQDGHFGVLGMRERMKRLGGRLELRSEPGKGTTITLRLRHTRSFGSRLTSSKRV